MIPLNCSELLESSLDLLIVATRPWNLIKIRNTILAKILTQIQTKIILQTKKIKKLKQIKQINELLNF